MKNLVEFDIKENEIISEEQLDEITGGASFKSWFQAIGGTVIGMAATATAICTANPALAGVAIVSLANGAKGFIEIAKS